MTVLLGSLLVFGSLSLLGVGCLVTGIRGRRYWLDKEQNETVSVIGTVTDVVKIQKRARGNAPVSLYLPVITFKALAGTEYTLQYEVGTHSRDEIEVGGRADVLYDPRDPEKFHLDGDRVTMKEATATLWFGAIVEAIALAVSLGLYFRLI